MQYVLRVTSPYLPRPPAERPPSAPVRSLAPLPPGDLFRGLRGVRLCLPIPLPEIHANHAE